MSTADTARPSAGKTPRPPHPDNRLSRNRRSRARTPRARPHRAVLQARLREGFHIVDPPRPCCFPMRHERPARLLLGQRLLDDLTSHRLPMRHLNDCHACRFRIERIGFQLLAGRAFMRIVSPSIPENVPLTNATTVSPGKIAFSITSRPGNRYHPRRRCRCS